MKNLAETDINRFIEAQEVPYFCGYKQALEEVKNGRKTNHWIWYIFPQLRCLGRSSRAYYYGIANRNEAQRYLEHPILGARIREITEALLEHKDKTALSIVGDIGAVKVRSCMTMFDFLSPNDIFGEVLLSFYNEERCETTIEVMTNKHIITDRAEIEKHVHREVWAETVSKYQELCSVLIEIPAGELKRWLDSYSEKIALICKNALTPFQGRADEISYIYIEYGGESRWLRRFAEDEGSWYEMLCDEVLPSWMSCETKWDFYPSIEDALDVKSAKQGLHIYVTLCFKR